jgi:HD-like signal output (HDOD) protein
MATLTETTREKTTLYSQEKFARMAKLPPLPSQLMEALQQLHTDQHTAYFADKISLEPILVTRILRIANSPFFGMSREIGSLREAIILLGLDRIRDLMLGICLTKMLPIDNRCFNYKLFCRHCMAVADCTRQFANYTGTSPHNAYTAGLLHDIGRPVIIVLYPEFIKQIANESTLLSSATERQLFGFDHLELGGIAAKHWNLPLAIQESIEFHETPPAINNDQSLPSLIYVANLIIAGEKQFVGSPTEYEFAINSALEKINIPFAEAQIFANTGQQFADQIVSLL